MNERHGAPGIEHLGTSGLWEIASDLIAAGAARSAMTVDAPSSHSPSKKIRIRSQRYVAHDVHGSRCAVTLAFSSQS